MDRYALYVIRLLIARIVYGLLWLPILPWWAICATHNVIHAIIMWFDARVKVLWARCDATLLLPIALWVRGPSPYVTPVVLAEKPE